MESVWILVGQLILMFLYLAVGFFLQRAGIIPEKTVSALSGLLLYIILPCVILRSYLTADPAEATTLLVSIGLGAMVLLLAMVVARCLFRKDPVSEFGAAFSNAGFIGIPLISATLGAESVCYISGMVALLNILQWTYGQARISGSSRDCAPKALVKNPLVLAFVLGLVLFFQGCPCQHI